MKICVRTDENGIVKSYGEILDEDHSFTWGTVIETDLDLEIINLADNYKLVNGQLVELQETEKPVEPIQPDKMEVCLNELSEALLESEMRAVESEIIINETSNYVLDLDERLTNIELEK